MKKIFILSVLSLTHFICFAQIKVFSGGSVTIGGTTSPTVNNTNHHIIGSTIVFPSTTATVSSAPLIVGQSSVSSSPGFAFLGDYQTGIAHPASSVLAITIANSEKFRFNSSNQILSVNTTSSATTPDYSWNSDNNTGMYRYSEDILGFATGGAERMRLGNDGQILNSNASSSATNPHYSWNSDNNTGMYRYSEDILGFATGGVERMRVSNVGQILNSNASSSAGNPHYSWKDDDNTGMFRTGEDILAFSTGGNERMRMNSTGVFVNGTSGSANFNIYTTSTGAFINANHSADWNQSMVIETNRANSANYLVKLSGTTNFYVAGQGWIYSEGNYLGSDKTIKDDIKSIDSAMSKINKINGVTYKLKKEKQNPGIYGNANEYMGVIAQDVEAVAPQVVKVLQDGTKAVCYEMLVGLLVEALKEQNVKVNQLEKDVNSCCLKNNNRLINTSGSNINTENNLNSSNSFIKQNAPNPFSKETVIEFYIAEKNANASILIFDMTGKLLKTLKLNGTGIGSVTISGNDFKPGMYYYSLILNDKEIDTKKMILTE